MVVLETIVVPLDGSATARHAIAPAALLARQWGVPVQLVTVMAPGLDPRATRRSLEREVDAIDAPTRPSEVLTGEDVAVALDTHVDAHRPALLCMATHGRSAVATAVLGSVAHEVVRGAHSPVLLVGPRCVPSPEQHDVCLALKPGSPASGRALSPAIGWARASGARLHLVAAVTASLRMTGDGPRVEDDPEAREELGELARYARTTGVTTCWRVVDGDRDVAGAVLDAAARASASVVVAATHGRRSVTRLVLGSVAQDLVRRSTCPVLVVPPHSCDGHG